MLIQRILQVRVIPKARLNKVVPQPSDTFRIYVSVPAQGGEANRAVLKLLAKYINVAPSRLVIVKGMKCRDKIIHLYAS